MKIKDILFFLTIALNGAPCVADSLFFEDEAIQDGLSVFEVSKNFAEIYQKLDGVNWAGKNLNVAIESLESLNPKAHIAATDERIVLVWGDEIIANYPRPNVGDWNAFGEITTALILKMRAQDKYLHNLSESEMYQFVVDSLIRGIDEDGRYVFSKAAEVAEDGRLLTSVGLEGARDNRGNFRVNGIYKGAPADLAGIHQGDLIVQINGKDLPTVSDMEIAEVLSGFNSGTAKIKLLTPTGDKDVVLGRATVVVADADVVHRSNPDGAGILEIVVHQVSDAAVSIINEALARYSDLSGIVLDLRSAIGDDERAAAKLAGLFVGKKPVMRIVETARDEVEVVPGADAVTDAPTVVVVSNMTRGTAEAVAGAFYENSRGVLIGTPTNGAARIATRIDLDSGGALELLNKSIKTGAGHVIDGRGIFPIVCLSNIRSSQQQQAFFLNVINNDFNARDFNKEPNVSVADIRRGCPTITSGGDEDALAAAVSVKILTDKKLYNNLIVE
ncbi:MAG: PDZ domain-containing protein [Alphaproteobacteria bacterium]|nr:PDZ domain-containing protein [Alphaproteobacteria bacterium]